MGFIKNFLNRRKKKVQALEAGKEVTIQSQQAIQEMIKNLKEKIEQIRYAVPEKYKEFSERASKIEEEIIEYDDSKNSIEEKRKIIDHIAFLELDFYDYLRNGEKKEEIELELIPESKKTTSGNEAIKAHRIKLYKSICENIKSKDEIDEEAIKNVIEAWKKEKEKFTYSQPEKERVDKILAELVLDYQIQNAQRNGMLDKNILEKLNQKVYNNIIAECIRKTIEEIPLGDFNRLKLETIVGSSSNEEIAENEETWRTILKYKCGMPEGKIEQILNKKEEKPQENIVNKPQQMEEKTETKEIKPQKFTFLIQEQICGDNSLDIFRKRGKEAAITDFSILLGGYAYVKGEWSLEGRTGWYWTKSDNGANDARVVSVNGTSFYSRVNERDGGARPALMLSSIDRIPTNGVSGALKKATDGVLEVEYGYYPQKAVSRDMQERLERAYLSRKHIKNKK